MPHPIFEIDELLRAIADELVKTSRRSAVSLALTCRSLEEPTLSSLWKEQSSLHPIIAMLPNTPRAKSSAALHYALGIASNPSAETWARLQRYASWMRGVDIGVDPSAHALSRLSRGSPNGLLFPKLEWLVYDPYHGQSALPFFCLFLSPHLRRVNFITGPKDVAALAQVISALPTSLESLHVELDEDDVPANDALSSLICRCGPSLRSFGDNGPLSDAATLHLMQLPNLSCWTTDQEPPQVTSTPVLQSLEHFCFDGHGALPWLRFLASDARKGSRTRLKSLEFYFVAVADSTFLSYVVSLRNLVKLQLRNIHCSTTEGCLFRLTDDNVKDLAAALPHLESLQLGYPCALDTCKTTAASLISISAHCPDLLDLEMHLSARRIVDEMQCLLDGGVGYKNAKCQLRSVRVGIRRFLVSLVDLQTVEMGLGVIFPHLKTLDYAPALRRRMQGVGG